MATQKFDRRAVNPNSKHLNVTQNGKIVKMAVATMNDALLKAALMRPDNKGALAPGWAISNGAINKVATPTAPAGNTQTGGQPAQQPEIPIANPINGATQFDAAQWLRDTQTGTNGQPGTNWYNAQIQDLQAGNMAKFNTKTNELMKMLIQNKHGYNAQSAAAGFRKSGGVRKNNMNVDAYGSQQGMELNNTLGQGAIDNLKKQKNEYIDRQQNSFIGTISNALRSNL